MPVVELSFPVRGTPLPYDNGYIVYRAVARVVPWVREPAQTELAILPAQGDPRYGFLNLTAASRLAFRLDSDDTPRLLPLAGQRLEIPGGALTLGQPTRSRLRPVPSLMSMFVVADRYGPSDEFHEWLKAEARGLNIRPVPTLRRKRGHEFVSPIAGGGQPRDCPYARHNRQIGDNAVVGWEVQFCGLKPEESTRLQERGIGPGRRYGCGVFVPLNDEPPRRVPRRRDSQVWFPQT